MFVQKLQEFVEHPISKMIDVAALTTSATYFFPDFRASLHEWGMVFTDLAPIAAFVWLVVQTVCKIIVTYHHVNEPDEDEE